MQATAAADPMPTPAPLERREFCTASLMAAHPPRWHHPNKQAVYEIACPPGLAATGTMDYSRWPALPLPPRIDPRAGLPLLEVRADVYDYAPHTELPGSFEWHVNFADPHLFVAYAGPLFAQDEIQVAEHPALASLKQALSAEGLPTLTVEGGRPTPVLITGVERRCQVDTAPSAAAGRQHGLYGNTFARASEAVVRRATTAIRPPTRTHLIAVAAPEPDYCRYTAAQIEYTLTAAYTGFRAAVLEASRHVPAAPVVVHTGFWGCGAFGGNRVLMPALQLIAAGVAGIDRLVFHTVNVGGVDAVQQATSFLRDELGASDTYATGELIAAVVAHGFEWGESDGN